MKHFIFGHTVNGLPMHAFRFGNNTDKGKKILILGGVHGDEIEGVAMANQLLEEFKNHFPYKLEVTLVPTFNLEGTLAGTRHNANGVDLNRNLPTKDWDPKAFNARYFPGHTSNSEPENHALVNYITSGKVDFILTLHSFRNVMVNMNGDCKAEADLMSQVGGYPVTTDMGYPTPGSLGTYAGVENKVPTITYELLKGQNLKTLLPPHIKAVRALLQYKETH